MFWEVPTDARRSEGLKADGIHLPFLEAENGNVREAITGHSNRATANSLSYQQICFTGPRQPEFAGDAFRLNIRMYQKKSPLAFSG